MFFSHSHVSTFCFFRRASTLRSERVQRCKNSLRRHKRLLRKERTGAGPLITATDCRFRTATSRRLNRSLSHSQYLRISRRYVLVPPSAPGHQQAVPFIAHIRPFNFGLSSKRSISPCEEFSSVGEISGEKRGEAASLAESVELKEVSSRTQSKIKSSNSSQEAGPTITSVLFISSSIEIDKLALNWAPTIGLT